MKRVAGIVAISVAWLGCGGSFFVAKDKTDSVKKIAVVQYAINPHILVGAASGDDAKSNVAEQNLDTFRKEFGNAYQVVPASEVVRSSAYVGAGGKASWDGYFSGNGMQFFSADEAALKHAILGKETAASLCEALGVDGVVAIYDSWGFQTVPNNSPLAINVARYVINLFDKEGNRVWGGHVAGASETRFATYAGMAIADNRETWTRANNESFIDAMDQVKIKVGVQ